jgi:hypothetical protein
LSFPSADNKTNWPLGKIAMVLGLTKPKSF